VIRKRDRNRSAFAYFPESEMMMMMIMMNWKGVGRKRQWPNFKKLSQHFLGVTEEHHQKPQFLAICRKWQ
jgi:hypothetical protein